ncbi:MAG: hypothetical protein K0R29_2409 [Pseudobdellovibrio sp.]|nr:hypothetical protein [Pseudobdellovibrio sp.]
MFAVIFSSKRAETSAEEYKQVADRMIQLASGQKGFLGVESARNPDGSGITVSYWQSLDDIKNWKLHSEHLSAQQQGREKFYSSFKVKICKVERQYEF